MTSLPFGLPAMTVEKIRGVFARHPPVERAIVYGSRAKGTATNGSDIDLTLQGNGLVHEEMLRIMTELDDLLLPYTIDLSLFHMIEHAGLREHIERAGLEFYQRQEAGLPWPNRSE